MCCLFSRHLWGKDYGWSWFLVFRLSHLWKLWYLSRSHWNLDNHLHRLWEASNNLHASNKGWKTFKLSNQLDDLCNMEHGISNCCPTFNEYQFLCFGGKIWTLAIATSVNTETNAPSFCPDKILFVPDKKFCPKLKKYIFACDMDWKWSSSHGKYFFHN